MAQHGAGDDRDREERIRQRAYSLWLEAGCPEGRAEEHWDKACELVAIEENYRDTLKPNPQKAFDESPTGEPVEPIEAVRNLGEFPTLTDQGEEAVFPDRALIGNAAGAAANPERKGAPRSASRRKPA